MRRASLLSSFLKSLHSGYTARRQAARMASSQLGSHMLEKLENRMLLSVANDLVDLSDEFDDAATQTDWHRVNEVENWNADQLQIYDIDQTQPGRMVMAPHSVVWYQNWRGPMAFREVTGDFVITTEVHITDRDDIGIPDGDDIPDEATFSLGGVMIRTPRSIADPAVDWLPGSMADDGTNNGENYVFLSLGHGTNGQFTFEVKTTRNSDSQLELTPVNSNTATLQLARIGNSVIALMQVPGQDWIVHRRYTRTDMPETLQVGLVSYTDWNKAGDFDPFYHNNTTLDGTGFDASPGESYNPDLVAGYEYARYFRPQVPAELQGVDLVNAATDEQLLSFLGANANQPGGSSSGDLPVVSVNAASSGFSESAGHVTGFLVTRTGPTDDALTVNYSVNGSATAGDDYQPLTGTVQIPAGESSVSIDVHLIDDSQVEGAESVAVALIDEVFYELGDPAAELEIADDDFQQIGDQVMSTEQESLVVSLPAAYPDGTILSYAALLVSGGVEYELDQQYDFFTNGSYHDNWGGQNERWLQTPAHGWFYLLPDGGLFRWIDSFPTSEFIVELPLSVYQDPSHLIDAEPIAAVVLDGHDLTIDPAAGFVGTFEIDVAKDNGVAEEMERLTVTVLPSQNDAPIFEPIADQVMSRSDDELHVPFIVSDPDGDPLLLSAAVVESELWQLDQQYEFASAENYYDNWGGQNERWVNAGNGGAEWFYLLPDGSLYEWQGDFGSSQQVAELGGSVYEDPALLTDPVAIPVDVSLVGDEVVVNPAANFVGSAQVVVMANDGLQTSQTGFFVEVTNVAPVLQPIGDPVITNPAGTLAVALQAADADGDVLEWSVKLVQSAAATLDTELDLVAASDFFTNWGGQNEKWLRNSAGDWFFILPDGSFNRWQGSFESSDLLATLDAEYYDDPNLIADPETLPVEASIVGSTLNLQVPDGFTDNFQLIVTVSDGIDLVSELVDVSIDIGI